MLILVFLVFTSCAQDRIAKPKSLMSIDKMINFHVDLALLNASSSYAKDNFVSIDSLYVFHEIDSITFVQSNMYYASKPKLYAKILESAKAELERFQEQDTLPELEMPIR
tara:strand:- start:317 stop:646 length:330 start_codon:yes stop_codon:yes gene_type:complete